MRDSFDRRRQRIHWWLARECAGERMLELSLEVLDLQEELYNEVVASDWGTDVLGGNGSTAFLDLSHLPLEALVPRFRAFVHRLAPGTTDVLASIAAELESAALPVSFCFLESFAQPTGMAELASGMGHDEAAVEFYPKAFLQPIAEALTEGGAGDLDEPASVCPLCGHKPQASVLRDEAEVKGRRYLVCSFCSTWWPFRRATCPQCGEADSEKLLYHTTDTLPHVRVEECGTCHAYVKGFDLRQDGHVVPVVDDVATVELDVWASERDLWKVRPNLMGL